MLDNFKVLGDDKRVLPGGGAIETQLSQELKNYAKGFASREQIAIEAFSDALTDIPRCLAENHGLNPIDILLNLKKHHAEEQSNYGVAEKGCGSIWCA